MQVFTLEIRTTFLNQEIVLNPSVIQDKEAIFLVDCGYAGSLELISNCLEKYNLSLKDFTGIIISHDDIDHLGGLCEIKTTYPHIKVFASQIEAPYVAGEQKSLRLIQAENAFTTLPEAYKSWAVAFQKSLNGIKRVPVDSTFSFDTSFSENIKIINTPGHTLGHISIYLPHNKILIANDAVVLEQGELAIANPQFTLNLEQAVASVNKLLNYQIDKLICYHGGEVVGNISEKLTTVLQKYKPELV
ncbi:MBL fold metallo-hydrolase [Adhaeribacter rhizoryzae]|nr:MBL fold metallo-hydrolase [Adhaeribacter rhizoryzae]